MHYYFINENQLHIVLLFAKSPYYKSFEYAKLMIIWDDTIGMS